MVEFYELTKNTWLEALTDEEAKKKYRHPKRRALYTMVDGHLEVDLIKPRQVPRLTR